ncbi:MAG: aldehyde dehydrogenase family protein, partial [Nitrososphaerota archaeon]|nr:aldehyde dehydrogenase family protein [Nitrososphaerota archaeon]
MFENENTLGRLKAEGKEDDFHVNYEDAVEELKKQPTSTYPMIIGGSEVFAEGTFDDISPSDLNRVIGRFQKGTRADAKKAIGAARKAFEYWSQTRYDQRVAIYRKAATFMSISKFKLAAKMSFENGKNRFEAVADVDEAIDFLRYYAEQLDMNKGFEIETGKLAPNEHTKSILKPYGVWSVIAPFNFPLAIATGMSVGASIVGNTIVLKPASDTPLLSYELCMIMERAGLPDGVFNFVTGPGSTVGAELIENPDVDGVVFTGSWDV